MRTICTLALPVLVACTGPSYTAHLDNGGGVAEGARVEVRGVEVGEVRGTRLANGEAEIEFRVERGNELILKADACAVAIPANDTTAAYLEVFPGEAPTMLGEQAIPDCPLPTEQLGQLGEALGQSLQDLFAGFGQGMGQASQGLAQQMGQALQQASQGMAQGMGPGMQGMGPGMQGMGASANPPPFQPGTSGAPACDGLSVRVASQEAITDPVDFPDGGTKYVLEFRNEASHSIRLPAIGNALFMDGNAQPLPSRNLDGQTWFMPIDVPAAGSTQVAVAFDAAGAFAAIEVRQITRGDQPLDTCTLAQADLAP